MSTDDLARQIDQLVPKSLDDIIRTNRDVARLYLTTDAEINALRASVPPGAITGTISAWAFITMFMTKSGTAIVNLTGFNDAERCSWMTSQVMAIDGDTVVTRSGSYYRLQGERSDTPDLLHICATLHLWGVGPMLGVPHIFY